VNDVVVWKGWRRRLRPVVIVIGISAAYAVLLQPIGCNQTAHFALVKAIGDGTPRIDRYREETCDLAYIDGHFYAAKAPGLALATVPWYITLSSVGTEPQNPAAGAGYPEAMLQMPRRPIWELHLWGAAMPGIVLVLLVRRLTDEIERGAGWVVAATMGLGTMLLPFATDYFVHVLSALLGFAAFALLYFERKGPPRIHLVALAGLLAGLAITVEFGLGIIAVVLGSYAIARRPWVRRAGAFILGGLVGIVPLAAFNLWAFGAAYRLPYENAVIEPGRTGFDVIGANDPGFFGLEVPDPRVALELLFSAKGLLVLSPVLALAIVGAVLMYRSGRRPEALAIGAIGISFLLYNAGYVVPFGGFVPGPRFLIPTLPFLAVALASAVRRIPGVFMALAAASVTAMVVATAAEPMLGGFDTASWLRRWADGNFAHSVLTLVGAGNGWVAVAPFLVAVVAAVVAAAGTLPVRLSRRDIAIAAASLLAWGGVLVAAPSLVTVAE
jgi:hypothetical protein